MKARDYERSGKFLAILLFHQPNRIITRGFGPFDKKANANTAKKGIERKLNNPMDESYRENRVTSVHTSELWTPIKQAEELAAERRKKLVLRDSKIKALMLYMGCGWDVAKNMVEILDEKDRQFNEK